MDVDRDSSDESIIQESSDTLKSYNSKGICSIALKFRQLLKVAKGRFWDKMCPFHRFLPILDHFDLGSATKSVHFTDFCWLSTTLTLRVRNPSIYGHFSTKKKESTPKVMTQAQSTQKIIHFQWPVWIGGSLLSTFQLTSTEEISHFHRRIQSLLFQTNHSGIRRCVSWRTLCINQPLSYRVNWCLSNQTSHLIIHWFHHFKEVSSPISWSSNQAVIKFL